MAVCMELKNRATGLKLKVMDNTQGDEAPIKEDKSNRWFVRCDTHDTNHNTGKSRALAFAAITKPQDWCKGCATLVRERAS